MKYYLEGNLKPFRYRKMKVIEIPKEVSTDKIKIKNI